MADFVHIYKRIFVFVSIIIINIIGLTLIVDTPVNAQTYVIQVPSTRTIRGVQTPYLIGRANIPSKHIGVSCEVSTVATNDTSIHPESHIRVQTGLNSYDLQDVERSSGAVTSKSRLMTLAEVISVHIVSIDKLGYSADVKMEITCTDEASPEPTAPTPTTSTTKPKFVQPTGASQDTRLPDTTGPLPRTGPAPIMGLFLSSSLIGAWAHRRYSK